METLEIVINGMIIVGAISSIYAVGYQMRKVQGDTNRVCESMTSVNDALVAYAIPRAKTSLKSH